MNPKTVTGGIPEPPPQSTDYHCHLLPGIDDGPGSMQESVEMARLLAGAGYRAVHCTPHMIRYRYDADNATVLELIRMVQHELDREGIPLRLLEGREYYLDDYLLAHLDNPMPLEGSKRLLVEIPPGCPAGFAREVIGRILKSGFTVMIAHPERCPLFDEPVKRQEPAARFSLWKPASANHAEPRRTDSGLLDWLAAAGCAFQGNLGSFTGAYGSTARSNARRFSAAGLYTHFGTDAHAAADLDGLSGMVRHAFRT